MSQAALIRLMSWLSPVFPTGNFAYSAGLEQAVAVGLVTDEASLTGWLQAQLAHGSPWNDAVLLAASWRAAADTATLASLAELATALSGSAERNGETLAQGRSFLEAATHWFPAGTLPLDGASAPLPVAIGAAAGAAGIALDQALAAWLQAFISNQLQAAIRLSVTGQNGAARLLAALEPAIAAAADRATRSTPDDLGSFAFTAEIASMQHETLQPRLFLS
ncbi:urease accessory protein UreF [Zhengella mangrovi]|uniref:Urease accessory protein UreF n=1 Tax=Zhengella mangrovi TaxID=1982044 RepID=A0A2G1QU34_9HYPH|nr:urease accessory UreF family protein [Zhengella mangrovi]PHP68995.1 urease accessory protein UreF [Zhengella mangrovi]